MAGRGHRDIFAEDIEWLPGSEEGVEYTRFLLDDDSGATSPMVVMSRFAPGAEVPPHTHGCNYLEYIVEGSQMVGKSEFKAGDVRWARGGAGYGPIKVGPEGCTVIIFFQEAGKSMTIPLGKAKKLAEAAS